MLLCAALLLLCLVCTGAVESQASDAPVKASAAADGEAKVEAAKEKPEEQATPSSDAAPAGPAAAALEGETLVSSEQVMMAVGAVATLCCMVLGWFLMNQGGPKKRKFKGDAVFLVGPCDSGKTATMMKLRDGDSGNALRPTHSSMAFNESTFVLAGVGGKPVRIVDFPGHSRLRPQLFDMIEDCASLIFVIDACTFAHGANKGAPDLTFGNLVAVPQPRDNTQHPCVHLHGQARARR